MLSLGCPKNRVDSELIWAAAATRGLVAVDDPAQAEVIVVNTCAFVQSAVEESLDAIVEMGRFKTSGCCRRLIVAGCLTARYRDSLAAELPEVDLFVGPAEVGKLGQWLDAAPGGESVRCQHGQSYLADSSVPRVNSLASGAAYLKVAEGCSRHCSFCVIPSLRGPQQSRPLDDLVMEAENLIELGVREIVLVAQDLAAWGGDLPGRPELAELVAALAAVGGLRWLRLMYLFPTEIPERLIEVISGTPHVLPYLDIPVQHADRGVLARMRRGGDPATMVALIERLRRDVAGVVLRTTLMTGFPGEDESAYRRLVEFVEQCRIERLGVFAFSAEEGSPAAEMDGKVPAELAEARRQELLDIQRGIASDYHESLIGREIEVLVEDLGVGRAWNQAPEVDGKTVIHGRAEPGRIVRAVVKKAGVYDLEVDVSE